MKLINKLGQILGLFTSVFIVFSVFLSYVSLDVLEYSIFSWSLFELNKTVAIVIIVLAVLGFLFAYAQKGFLVSLLGIIIFVVNIFIFNNLSTGIDKIDEVVYMLESFFGEIFTPGFGFIFISAGAVVLFLSGVLLNKEKGEDKDADKKISKKVISIIVAVIVAVLIAAGGVVCFVYPGYLRKVHSITDERTGKEFEVVGGKVQVYLPVKVTCTSEDNESDNWSIEAKYNTDGRLIEKEEKRKNVLGDDQTIRSVYTYNIDGKISHISEKRLDSDSITDWSFEYDNDYVKQIKEERSSSDTSKVFTANNFCYEYGPNGMPIEISWNGIDENLFNTFNQEQYTYEYNDDGSVNKITFSGENPYTLDIAYEDDYINKMVLEGEYSREYWYDNTSITRKDSHISEIESNSITGDITTNSSTVFTYDYNGLDKVECQDEFSLKNRNELNHYDFDILYEDKIIKEISLIDSENNCSEDAKCFYDNGEISEMDYTSVSEDINFHRNIKIEYELFEIDMEDWNTIYKDYYYTYRYDILNSAIFVGLIDFRFDLISYQDGYFDQNIEYSNLQFGRDYDEMFEWVTLPKVLGREYLKKQD